MMYARGGNDVIQLQYSLRPCLVGCKIMCARKLSGVSHGRLDPPLSGVDGRWCDVRVIWVAKHA